MKLLQLGGPIYLRISGTAQVINKSIISRISLNCRFKSLLSPSDVVKKSTKNIPNFYKPINIKPMTKIGFNFLNKLEKKL